MSRESFDVVILGTGPAGLQAAIHAARKKVTVLVLGRRPQSSLYKAHVENFCCLGKVAGEDLLDSGREQAQKFGAQMWDEDVLEVTQDGESFVIKTESDREVAAKALVLAMGISRNKLGVIGEKELLGKGVSYCVDCDAGFYRGVKVAVVGEGSAAFSGALTMLMVASEVHLIYDQATVEATLAGQVEAGGIFVHSGRKVKAILGEKQVEGLELDNGEILEVEGVFIELGAKGAVALAGTLGVMMDPESMQYIAVDKKQAANLPGVYACGDITGPPWQVAKAVGEGCVAGLEAAAYAKRKRG
jgi:thioredoxin reductase (NADPH)